MKLNVVIADDEYFIRQRLIKIIDWKGLNFNFIGEAQDGLEVLSLIAEHKVDLILLDIKMPYMTGIEVAKYIYDHFPMTKIIILSGYNDFEYARSTIKYGVLEYLLKPVSSELLQQTLQECRLKIEKEKKAHQQIQRYYHYEKCSALYDTRTDRLPLKLLYDKYPELYEAKYGLFIGVFIHENMEHYMNRLMEILRHIPIDCEYFKETDYIYTIQLFLPSEGALHEVRNLLGDFLYTTSAVLFLTFSNLFSLEEQWKKPYKLALKMLKQRYFGHHTRGIIDSLMNTQAVLLPDASKIRQSLITYINTKDQEGFKTYLHTLLDDVMTQKSISYMHTVITEILLTYKIYYQDLIQLDHSLSDFVNAMLDEDYKISGIEQTILSYGLKCMKKETPPSDIVFSKRIITYIEENYANPDLSVAKLAEIFNLNTSYIGTLFKKVNNQSLLHYITTVRMEASKTLLKQNKYKIGEISEMVGYSDVFYYSKRFKKMYGYSPKDYLQHAHLEEQK
ncbi:MAG: response regulator [Zhenhengia sp.]|uniref:response regulator transcription factor n=1 Tax=Zhenhengia sp. TaxID=2944208 RepID=UPI0039967C14